VTRHFLGVLIQNELSRAIGTDDLVFVADVKVDRRVAERTTAPVTTDDAAFNDNGRLQTHDDWLPITKTDANEAADPDPDRCRFHRGLLHFKTAAF
jgi:hypothetical protein